MYQRTSVLPTRGIRPNPRSCAGAAAQHRVSFVVSGRRHARRCHTLARTRTDQVRLSVQVDGASRGRCGMDCRLMGNEQASKLHVQTLKLFYSPADEQERPLHLHALHRVRIPRGPSDFGPRRSITQAGSVDLVIGQLVALGCKLESRHPYREQLLEGAQTVEKARPLGVVSLLAQHGLAGRGSACHAPHHTMQHAATARPCGAGCVSRAAGVL